MISYKDILSNQHFNGLEVLSGFNGLDNKINRILYFEKKEDVKLVSKIESTFLVISEDLFSDMDELLGFLEGQSKNSLVSGLALKESEEGYFNKNYEISLKIPLILIPKDYSIEDLKRAFNEMKLFNFISKNIKMEPNIHIKKGGDIDETIAELVKLLGTALNREVEIIDPMKERTYYSNGKILKISIRYYEEEYFRPDLDNIGSSTIENMKISSYKRDDQAWTVVPIVYNKTNMFYILVWEDDELGRLKLEDFKYLYISYMLLYILYGDIYFENKYKRRIEEGIVNHFIFDAEVNREEFYHDLKQLDKKINRDWTVIAIVDKYPENDMKYVKKELIQIVNDVLGEENVFMALLDSNILLVIYNFDRRILDCEGFNSDIREILSRIKTTRRSRDFRIGIGHITENIDEVKKSYEKSLKAVELGEYIYDGKEIIFYEDIGIIASLNIEELMEYIDQLIESKKKEILTNDCLAFLDTIGVFIKCHGNYKKAAEELYIHTNTLRYRINQIEEKFNIDMDNYDDLLKISILLKFEPAIRKRIEKVRKN